MHGVTLKMVPICLTAMANHSHTYAALI